VPSRGMYADDGGTGYVILNNKVGTALAPKGKAVIVKPPVPPTPNALTALLSGSGGGGGGSIGGQAAAIVGAELDPQIAALGQQIKQSKTSESQSLADIAKYYGAAGSSINASKGVVQGETNRAVNQIGGMYNLAGAAQKNIYGGAQKGIISELTRLGLGHVIPDASKQTASDARFMEAMTRLQGAGAKATARQMGTNTSGLISAIASEAAASGAQTKAQLQREMTRLIDNMGFQQKMIESTRKAKEMQVNSQLQQAASSQQMQRIRLGLEMQRAAGGGGSSKDPDYANLQKANLAASLALKSRELNAPAEYGKGIQGGLSYLKANVKDPATYGNYSNLLINASTQGSMADANALISNFQKQYKIPQSDANQLYLANSIIWGKG
jgi:hypothetical protein